MDEIRFFYLHSYFFICFQAVGSGCDELGQLYGMVQVQALVVSMKEIYGWLLMIAVVALVVILAGYSPVRPYAIFPKWKTVRRVLRRLVKK